MRKTDTERRIRRAATQPGAARLKRLKMGTRQEERNCRAAIRHAHRHRKAFEPLPNNAPLCQKIADRAIRLSSQIQRVRLLSKVAVGGNLTALAAVPAQLPGMMNAEDVVQLAPQQRRSPRMPARPHRRTKFA